VPSLLHAQQYTSQVWPLSTLSSDHAALLAIPRGSVGVRDAPHAQLDLCGVQTRAVPAAAVAGAVGVGGSLLVPQRATTQH